MIQFLVHKKGDTVGMATMDIKSGETGKGLYMDSQQALEIKVLRDIPFGHKIALNDMRPGDTVTKYGHDIGKVVVDIRVGDHVHIHNLKTKRW